MKIGRGGSLRRLGLVSALGAVAALAIASTTAARVDGSSPSASSSSAYAMTNDMVTICHAAGQAGTTTYVTLTISYTAAFGQAGHFYEDGTPRAGHENDYLGPCTTPPEDVCPNIDGVQSEVPDGMVKDEQGNCVTPPVDVCPNIDGVQSEVPDGMVKDEQGNCVTPPPAVDVCPNIDGVQSEVPDGMVKDEQGNCVTPPPPPPPPSPPTVKSDEFMDVQVIKDATPQVQLVNGQADISYTVRVRNNGPNQAHGVTVTDAAPSGVTFLAITQQPVNGNCTISAALLDCSLGTLGPGVERVIGFTARVTQTGTIVNSATGVGDGKDTNAANNTDDASTLVTAPVTPPAPTPAPKPKPTPKPKPDLCRVLKVTPGMVKADGKRQLVLAKVTRSRNPVKGVTVRFTGTGLNKVVKTDGQGVARLGITPSKAGIVLVRITSVKACNNARIGVVGVFEPPVTG